MRLFKPSLFKHGLLLLLVAGAALAQSESQIESDEVKRVGSHINCQCGGCNDDVNCMMSAGQCHFCKPTRTKIFQMQQAGVSDSGIIAALKKEFGDKIFRPDPSSSFWLVPYISLAAGLGIVVLILMRLRSSARKHALTPAAAGGPPVDDASLARYRDAIVDPSLILGALLGVATIGFLLLIRLKDLPPPVPVSPYKHLDERKAAIYENLRDLQFEYRLDKLSDSDYQSIKLELQKELSQVMAETDRIKAELGPAMKVPAALKVAPAAKKNECPACGATFEKPLKFCGECGKPMRRVG